MNVPLVDLKAEYQVIGPAVREAVERVLTQQQFVLGPTVDACEQAVAKWIQGHSGEPAGRPDRPTAASITPPADLVGVGVASGTDALILALRALGIGSGDAVITSPYTFFATASSIVLVGAVPIFVDIDPVTLTLNPRALAEWWDRSRAQRSSPRVRAVMPVHLFGHCADMGPILDLTRREGLDVIEDVAQAIGATWNGAAAGTIGRLGCLSFFPTKNLGGYGDGGMVLTGDAALASRLRRLRNHGMVDRYHHEEVGVNSRLDALQAAVLLVKLDYLEAWTAARRRHARRYAELFAAAGVKEWIVPPTERPGLTMVYHHYVVRAKRRDELAAFLKQQGVGCEVYYPVPLHLQPCFGWMNQPLGSFPEAERASAQTLALPVFPLMTTSQQDYVVEQIRRFYRA